MNHFPDVTQPTRDVEAIREDAVESPEPREMASTQSMSRPRLVSVNKRMWHELSDDEKIERLHGIVKDQQRVINRQSEFLDSLIGHEHVNGHIMKRVSDPGGESSTYGFKVSNRPDEWF